MSRRRYDVSYETVHKSLIEEVVETVGLETDEAVRATITDELTGESESGVGTDREDALEVACRKLGISRGDLEEDLEDD